MRVENLNKQMVRARFKNDLISRGKVKEERDYDYASLGKILANICVTSLISVIAPISTKSRKFSLAKQWIYIAIVFRKGGDIFLVENGMIKIWHDIFSSDFQKNLFFKTIFPWNELKTKLLKFQSNYNSW